MRFKLVRFAFGASAAFRTVVLKGKVQEAGMHLSVCKFPSLASQCVHRVCGAAAAINVKAAFREMQQHPPSPKYGLELSSRTYTGE